MRLSQVFFFTALLAAFNLGVRGTVQADDPGITKVRIIQLSDSTYVFEADVPQILLNSISEPIFPERFRRSDLSFANESGWITIRVMYTTSGSPLSSGDEILLQWNRNGVDVTAQWQDGSTLKVLFNRTLGGIRIPLAQLMKVERTTWSVVNEGFFLGINHFTFKGIHVLLVLLVVLLYPSVKSLRYILWFSSGHYVAMFLTEIGIIGFDLLLTDLLIILACILFSIHSIYQKKISYLGLLLAIIGIVHGLSYVYEIRGNELTKIQQIQSLFAFNLATDLGHFLVAIISIFIFRWTGNLDIRWAPFISGSIAIFLVLLVFDENVLPGNQRILEFESSGKAPIIRSPGMNPASRQTQRGTGLMNTPVVTYLSVEPYEVRQEILFQGKSALESVGMQEKITDFIPVEVQESLKNQMKDSVVRNTSVRINGRIKEPAEIQAHFVTLNRGGVSSRQDPMVEYVERAIIGLTLVYDIEAYPDSIVVEWDMFPPSSPEIEASAVDPHGALTITLSPTDNQINWKNRLAGYQAQSIDVIEIQRPFIPLISIILWIAVIVFLVYSLRREKKNLIIPVVIVASTGFGFYPFMRTDIKLPFLSEGAPNKETTGEIMEDLLTNVYLAFDRRMENQVYDRLAITVVGDQLTDIYLQNRQSMALESRGGARAKVDEVSIQELYEVKRGDDDGFIADVLWTVRGSVNHFGHTHYRQNQYRALVSFVDVDNTWKISDIETLDERRIY